MELPFILISLLSMGVPLAALVFFGWLGLRFVRARERDALRAGEAPDRAELARVHEVLQGMQEDLRRLQERQDFVERLLEKPRDADC